MNSLFDQRGLIGSFGSNFPVDLRQRYAAFEKTNDIATLHSIGDFGMVITNGFDVHHHKSDSREWHCLLLGDLCDRRKNLHDEIEECLKSKNPAKAISSLDGQFCCALIQDGGERIHLFSDTLGKRSIRYLADSKHIHFSSHLANLIQITGHSLVPDFVSIASSVSNGWSLGGESLVEGVETTRPLQVIEWQQNHGPTASCLVNLPQPIIDSPTEQNRVADSICQTLTENLASIDDPAHFRIQLTAGFDSRAMLVLAQQALAGRCVSCATDAGKKSYDVDVGKRLAKIAKLPYRVNAPRNPVGVDRVLSRLSDVAFHLDGDESASQVGIPPVPFEPNEYRLYGNGGEVYRGYYYPATFRRRLQRMNSDSVQQRLFNKVNANWGLFNDDLRLKLNLRFDNAIQRLTRVNTGRPVRILDLFYLFERYRIWNRRTSLMPQVVCPLESPTAFRAAYSLSDPISNDCLVLRKMINRASFQLRWTLINRSGFVATTGESGLRKNAERVARRCIRIARSRRNRPNKIDSKGKSFFDGKAKLDFFDWLFASDKIVSKFLDMTSLSKQNMPNSIAWRLATVKRFFEDLD